nr:MAG TPA: hypothetical protein [Caudoviricetes sp.]DAH10086.1 MAG TPA: hypothetical protein [Caudoviricetes sp.]
MEKTIYIPGDFVMTNGIPIGTKKGIVYQVTESNAEKIVKDGNEYTILRGSVTLSNIKGKTFHDEGFLFGDCGAWVKDIVPIPLTPSILEKNGWKVSLESTSIYVKEDNVKIFRLLDDIHYAAYIGFVRLLEFQHIHQLQHLLFGLGLNSEMEV